MMYLRFLDGGRCSIESNRATNSPSLYSSRFASAIPPRIIARTKQDKTITSFQIPSIPVP
jgi:hypothetical protein